MALEIEVPQFSPMYHKIWWYIADSMPGLAHEAGHPPLTSYRIVDSRNAVAMDARRKLVWHHLCHPRKLYRHVLNFEVLYASKVYIPRWEICLSYAYLNRNHEGDQCVRCSHTIDRNTRNFIRMEALGMLVK